MSIHTLYFLKDKISWFVCLLFLFSVIYNCFLFSQCWKREDSWCRNVWKVGKYSSLPNTGPWTENCPLNQPIPACAVTERQNLRETIKRPDRKQEFTTDSIFPIFHLKNTHSSKVSYALKSKTTKWFHQIYINVYKLNNIIPRSFFLWQSFIE